MVRILLGALAIVLILFGFFFWYSESHIVTLNKKLEANIAKTSEQDATIKAYADRLSIVENQYMEYITKYQSIQTKTSQVRKNFSNKNVSSEGLVDSTKASQDVTDHFNSIFTDLSVIQPGVTNNDKK